jgi:hypothetical protein
MINEGPIYHKERSPAQPRAEVRVQLTRVASALLFLCPVLKEGCSIRINLRSTWTLSKLLTVPIPINFTFPKTVLRPQNSQVFRLGRKDGIT